MKTVMKTLGVILATIALTGCVSTEPQMTSRMVRLSGRATSPMHGDYIPGYEPPRGNAVIALIKAGWKIRSITIETHSADPTDPYGPKGYIVLEK